MIKRFIRYWNWPRMGEVIYKALIVVGFILAIWLILFWFVVRGIGLK